MKEDKYSGYDESKTTIMNMVGDEVIGQKNYSDRTPAASGEERQDEGTPDDEGHRVLKLF
ncbi:hypothetical protein [Natrarchaeobaculum aegyptiacum]|uniref:hypothetical protein n=1 Tax=Natrarchaeobaculum aegyptiacum TaxID=745377 RepID=UPI0016433675